MDSECYKRDDFVGEAAYCIAKTEQKDIVVQCYFEGKSAGYLYL